MKLLELKDFEKAYPFLVKRINEIRGSQITEELPPNKKIPIEMQDAAFADSFLKTNNAQKNLIGYKRAEKILEIVKLYPNIDSWIERLYPSNNLCKKKLSKDKAKIVNEIVVKPEVNSDGSIYCVDDNNNKYYSDVVPKDRILRAYKKGKIIRLRKLDNGKYKCRIIKITNH